MNAGFPDGFAAVSRLPLLTVVTALVLACLFGGLLGLEREWRTVRGLTTGSGMWLAASVGLASGVGAYFLAGLVALLGFLILRLIGMIERTSESGPVTTDKADADRL